jgi:hypothetical protein
LEPERLPGLWKGEAISVQDVIDYFKGDHVAQAERDGYMEPLPIPKTSADAVKTSVAKAVQSGALWLTNGPASILAEPIPAGILNEQACLQKPPAMIAAAEILPENLPQAWQNGEATALSIASALSQKTGRTLPWKTVSDVISASLHARFTQLDAFSGEWPCDFPSANGIKLEVAAGTGSGGRGAGIDLGSGRADKGSRVLVASGELKPSEIQELGDVIPQLLELKNKADIPLAFLVQIELGDGQKQPDDQTVEAMNRLLNDVSDGFQLKEP